MRQLLPILFFALALVPAASGQNAAVPESGEGDYKLLSRNGLEPSRTVLEEFREINRGKFTRTGGLRKGIHYALPTTSFDEPQFGEDYHYFEPQSDRAERATIYLISGHGGPGPGAKGKHDGQTIYEDEYAYDNMLRFGQLMMANGATVHFLTQDNDGIRNDMFLTPDKDERHFDGTKVKKGKYGKLKRRTDQVNRLYKKNRDGYHRVIEFHVDSFRDPRRQIDIDFYFGSLKGYEVAKRVHDIVGQKYAEVRPGRGYRGRIERGPWFKIAIPIVTYIELGNVRNRSDQFRILQWDNRQLVAEWLAEGFLLDIE